MTLGLHESCKANDKGMPVSSKQFSFTLRDGKLVMIPEDNFVSPVDASICNMSLATSSKHWNNAILPQQDEVFIEIFRDNHQNSNFGNIFESHNTTNCISSAYGVFWQEDFHKCIEKRTCFECGYISLTPQKLIHHLQESHKISNTFECFVCNKLFINKSERANHLLKSHSLENEDWTCEVCFQQFSNELEKEAHRLTHKLSNKCLWCSASFPCKYLLKNHLQSSSNCRNDLVCHTCGFNFRTSHMLMMHRSRHSKVTCEICDSVIFSASNPGLEDTEITFIRHLRRCHNANEINNLLESYKNQDDEEDALDDYFLNQAKENLFKLDDSNFSENLQVEQANNGELFDITDERPNVNESRTMSDFPCTTVQQSIDPQLNISDEKKHNESLSCHLCSHRFESAEKLAAHEKSHNITNSQFVKHNDVLKTEGKLCEYSVGPQESFFCDLCQRKFLYLREYKKHMRSHDILVNHEARWYNCSKCPVRCATMSGLRIHLLTHTDQKPYLCEKCGLRFRRPRALKAHELAVHNPRDLHQCPQCESTSPSRSSLLRHIQCVHGGIRRFICGLCGARWQQNQDLRRHLQVKHNIHIPPMDSLSKKSANEIHVIPPINNLKCEDPLAGVLRSAISEEQLKIDAIGQCKIKPGLLNESQTQILGREPFLDSRQSLSILGEVASKASPLQKITSSSKSSLSSICSKFDGINSNTASSNTSNPLIVYSLPIGNHVLHSSKAAPNQLYFFPSTNGESSAVTLTTFNLTCSEDGCNSGVASFDSGSISGYNQSTVTLSEGFFANPIESSKLCEKDSVNQPQDNLSNFALQDNYLTNVKSCMITSEQSSINSLSLDPIKSCKLPGTLQDSSQQKEDKIQSKGSQGNSSQTSHSELSHMKIKVSHSVMQQDGSETSSLLKGQYEDLNEFHQDSLNWKAPNYNSNVKAASSSHGVSHPVVNDAAVQNALHLDSKGDSRSNFVSEKIICSIKNPVTSQSSMPSQKITASGHKTCPECGKELSSSSSYRRHLQVHSGEKSHKCVFCGKCFLYKCNLTVHLRSHTGERPYECSVCKKKLRYQTELKEHQQSHEGSKSYNCSDCGQKFTRRRDLNRHSLSHHSLKKTTCHICQKSFARLDYMKMHLKSHRKFDDADDKPSQENISLPSPMRVHEGQCDGNSVMPRSNAENLKVQTQVCNLQNSPRNDINCSSEDLISLAFQAAEDGVEFMFVEQIESSLDPNQILQGSINGDLFVQT